MVTFAAHAPTFAPAALKVWMVRVSGAVNAAQVRRARIVVRRHVGLDVGRTVRACTELKLANFASKFALAFRRAPAARGVLRTGGAASVGAAPLFVGQHWRRRGWAARPEEVFFLAGRAAKHASILVRAPTALLALDARVGVLARYPAIKLGARVVGVCFHTLHVAAIALLHFLLVRGAAFDAPGPCRAPAAAVDGGAARTADGRAADVCNTRFPSFVVVAAASHRCNRLGAVLALRFGVCIGAVRAVGRAPASRPTKAGLAVEAAPGPGGNVVVQLFGGAKASADCLAERFGLVERHCGGASAYCFLAPLDLVVGAQVRVRDLRGTADLK